MNRKQIQKLLIKYKSDLEFVNVDSDIWDHQTMSASPPSRSALLGLALRKCDNYIEYCDMLYKIAGNAEPEDKFLTSSLMVLSFVEGLLLATGFYSLNAIQNAQSKVMDEEG